MSTRFRFPLRTLVAMVVVIVLTASAFAQRATVTVLHVNDVYEISPQQGRGGFAPLMTVLKQERAAAPQAITTLGGDLIGSSMMSGITKGTQMIELMNAIGLDIAVVGNHEFDFGSAVLKQRIGESKFPWLGTNVLGEDGKTFGTLVPTLTRKVGELTLGFFGIITPDTQHLSNTGPDVKFAPVLDTARAAIKQLKDQGADAIVALTHLSLAEDRELAREVKGIDVILGGHDHDPISVYEGGVFIFKVGHDAQYLGVARIEIEKTQTSQGPQVRVWPREWRVVSTAGVAPDPAIAAIVKQHEDKLDESLKVTVGTTAVELDSRRATVRLKESALGNLFADAIREFTKAEAALTNGGGIRGDRTYAAGTTLTRKDILTELPFGNVAVLLEISGADLRAALEEGVSAVEDVAGRFPQVSGLRFVFDPRRPKGNRVLEVLIGGKPLDPSAIYKLATNEYMMAGGDGYASLKRGRPLIDASGGALMAGIVIDYIAARGTVSPAVEGRIVEQK
ncbi:MAG: bifunctional metallophosphatase/5'-nucleotidase [Candidatus Rokuibacteriota bacterium]|nr:MAG: bifunctional metallophosphatase/5'-nucleotidase [Candidatus Rokubacteria bacterium]